MLFQRASPSRSRSRSRSRIVAFLVDARAASSVTRDGRVDHGVAWCGTWKHRMRARVIFFSSTIRAGGCSRRAFLSVWEIGRRRATADGCARCSAAFVVSRWNRTEGNARFRRRRDGVCATERIQTDGRIYDASYRRTTERGRRRTVR